MVLERYRINNKGFTLVELMTVVAIIGALAALGVPQYKKMQRKAKRAEANMVLGVIASAEAAFYAEYNGYGTSMGGIGAEMDNDPQYYNVGFANRPVEFLQFGANAPAAQNPISFNGYLTSTIRHPLCQTQFFNGGARQAGGQQILTGIAGCFRDPVQNNALTQVPGPQGAAGPVYGCAVNFDGRDVGLGVDAANGNRPTFMALAAGNLYQNAQAALQADCLTIDHQRTINLRQDGS